MLDQVSEADIQRLRADVGRLREDIGNIGATLGRIIRENWRGSTCVKSDELHAKMEDAAQKANGKIDANPIAALLAAFGVGVVLGRLMRSK